MPVHHGWAVELDAFGQSYAGGWTEGNRWAVRGISLLLEPGQVLGLLGPNGSGKSTILKALAGLICPTEGSVRVMGHVAGSDRARRRVGYLPESVRFPTRQTGAELLAYCAGLSGVPAKRVAGRVKEFLAWAELESAAGVAIGAYSKGMRQRLGLAQAVIHDPDLVLLDEPASGLDPEGRLAVAALVRDLARRGRTVVLSSHLLAQAETICDRLALLAGGRLVAAGTPRQLLGEVSTATAAASPLERIYLEKCRGDR